VEPVCAVLEFSASTYYAVKKSGREPSRRRRRDEWLKKQIMRVRKDRRKGRGVYGAREVWRQLRREGVTVARCTVERLMRELGIEGAAARRRKPRTTVPATAGQPADLVRRDFTAPAPNRRRVADITYTDTAGGFAYTAFITDLFSRKIVGWQVADHLRADLALDALEMAIFSRQDQIGGDLVHHSDRGVQGEFNRSWYGSRHSLSDQGDLGVAAEPGALVVPAGAGLVAAPPVQPVSLRVRAGRSGLTPRRAGG
jgi:putative transposase